jgi:hypothetical protein
MKTVLAKCNFVIKHNNCNYLVQNEPCPIGYIPTIKLNFHHRTVILN